MEKKYQVFISSTYEDLKEERRLVQEAILEKKMIPRCMETFSPSDQSQWEIIEKVIEECDVFFLILAGRYGSYDNNDKIGFTEKEFNYAIKLNKPIYVFLHKNINELPLEKSETNVAMQKRLKKFRNKVKTDRYVGFWTNPYELKSKAISAIDNYIDSDPSGGWIQVGKSVINNVPPVFITTKQQLEDTLSLKEREGGASKIRLVNYAGTSFLANKSISTYYDEEWEQWFHDALRGKTILEIVLTKPDTPAAEDAVKFKMYPPQGCDIDPYRLIEENRNKLGLLYHSIKELRTENPQIKLIAHQTEIALPYALFETIFPNNIDNHIKVDLYSPLTGNDHERPSFMVYKAENPKLYQHFSTTISNIIQYSEEVFNSMKGA